MVTGKIWQNIQFVDNMKKQNYSTTVKLWFENYVMCHGIPVLEDEAESFYNAGFDDGAGCMCDAMRVAGIPDDVIARIYASLDPKGESVTYQAISEDWLVDVA
jgi:hypothetical protein